MKRGLDSVTAALGPVVDPALGAESLFPGCRLLLDDADWLCVQPTLERVLSQTCEVIGLAGQVETLGLPPFVPDLLRLEEAVQSVRLGQQEIPLAVDAFSLNPTLRCLILAWDFSHIWDACASPSPRDVPQPDYRSNWTLVWRDPVSGQLRVRCALEQERKAVTALLGNAGCAPEETGKTDVYHALLDSSEAGIILAPASRLARDPVRLAACHDVPPDMRSVATFTLQWHITHACDLHCKHCYDRSRRAAWRLDRALTVLDQMEQFCRDRFVRGHISFTGGNPFLHPDFFGLYQAAADRGFSTSLLANPTSRENVERVLAIQEPAYIQVSLEGLAQHNDDIRGQGHFQRTLSFLDLLCELNVESCVMLTLTEDNRDMVLPLAEMLRDRANTFTFNRLCPVGEGAALKLPSPQSLHNFLAAYIAAADDNPILGLKENLLNPILAQQGGELFDGCTGYGCGAAFNFLAVLPDGEVHACRKFPSQVGDLNRQNLAEIYDSSLARKYRAGSAACHACPLHYACGGCMAVVQGLGLNEFEDRDPFCPLKD